MSLSFLDYAVVIGFLVVTLWLGLRSGRGIQSMHEYVTGNRVFGTGSLVLTFLATNIAGSCVMHDSGKVFKDGLIMTIMLLSGPICMATSALYFFPKAASFPGCITMGDLMKRFYGPSSGIISGVLGWVLCVLIAGMDLIVLGLSCHYLLGIEAQYVCILIAGIGLALYVAHGGIKSVVATDIFHFAFLTLFIPLIAYLALQKVGGTKALLEALPAEKLRVWSHPKASYYLTLFFIWLIPAGVVDPAIIQRLLLARRPQQLRRQFLIVSAYDGTFRLVIMLIGLAGFVLYPKLSSEQIMPQLIHQLLSPGVRGLAMAGVLGASISTIDSYLHAAGVTFSHDILQPLAERRKSSIDELRWARYGTLISSLLATAVGIYGSFYGEDVLDLLFTALEFTSPILMFPLFSAMMGLKPHKRSFYIALYPTLLAFLLATFLLPEEKEHFVGLISIATNGLFFFGSHLWHFGGFVRVDPKKEEEEKHPKSGKRE